MIAAISFGAVIGPAAATLALLVLAVIGRRTDDPYIQLARRDRRAARRSNP